MSPKKKGGVSASVQALEDMLTRCRVIERGAPFSLCSTEPKGRYRIKDADADDFMTLYCNAITKGHKFCLLEKAERYAPLRLDFDLKLSGYTKPKRFYDRTIVKKIIEILHGIIDGLVDVDPDDPDGEGMKVFRCVLLEKSAARLEASTLKDGFHLHFPFLNIDSWVQNYIQRELILQMETQRVWKGTPFSKVVKDLLDTNIFHNPWLLYGSAKSMKSEPYLATKFYDENIRSVDVGTFFEEEMYGRKSSPSYYLPRFLSIKGIGDHTPLNSQIEQEREREIRMAKKKTANFASRDHRKQVMEDVGLIREGNIMNMLSSERAYDYKSWIEVGMALFSVTQGSEEGLDLWDEFSARDKTKYNP